MKILIIDDLDENLKTMSAVLRTFLPGCETQTASSGMLGIETACTYQPDVIILDMHMPGMDGFQTCQILKSDPLTQHIPVLFLTGDFADSEVRIRGLEIGAHAFLSKPVNSNELIAQIRMMLHIKQGEDALRDREQMLAREVANRTRALRQSEASYQSLVENLPDLIIRFDREGRYLFVSPWVEQLVGRPAATFIGRTHAELGFPVDQCRFVQEQLALVLANGACLEANIATTLEKKNVVFNCRFIPEWHGDGHDTVLCMARDITARLQAEQQYQMLFREMLNGFALHEIICDEQGRPVDYRFLAVNPAFERMTGLTAERLAGKTVREVIPDLEPHWLETYGRVALTGNPIHFENRAEALGRHYEVTAFCPAPGQFATIFADATNRKQTEESLRIEHANADAIFDSAPIGMLVLDEELNIVRANAAVAKLAGSNPAELFHLRPGQALLCIHSMESPDGCGHALNCPLCPLRKGVESVLAGSDALRGVEIAVELLRNGTPRTVWLRMGVEPLSLSGRRHVVVALDHLAARQQMEEELLAVGDSEKTRIGQDLHDVLGQQLTGTAYLTQALHSQLAKSAKPEAEQAAQIDAHLREAIVMVRQIVRGFLPVDMHAGGLTVSLEQLAAHTQTLFKIPCRFRHDSHVHVTDQAVATHLHHIVQEAVTNIVRHAKARHIDIRIESAQNMGVLVIEDDGIGLPNPAGIKPGMGLRIMRYRADLLGGSLTMERSKTGGTKVTCKFETGKPSDRLQKEQVRHE